MKSLKKYLVTYDIKDNRRRTLVSSELEGYGVRIQYSVFECLFSEKDLEKLIKKFKGFIEEEDNIRFYPMEKISKDEVIELGKHKEGLKDYLVI
ncbi:MAG: CRISPR-associated endonuclease Cas2 [Archaeoglobaceae archaeon]